MNTRPVILTLTDSSSVSYLARRPLRNEAVKCTLSELARREILERVVGGNVSRFDPTCLFIPAP